MKKSAIAAALICGLLGIFFLVRPPERFGSFGDGGNRAVNCRTGLSSQNAPVRYNLSLVGHYLTSKPIEGSTQNWGTCPYSNYKTKTFAAELWVLSAAIGLVAFKRNRT